jgi:hypothetical protein
MLILGFIFPCLVLAGTKLTLSQDRREESETERENWEMTWHNKDLPYSYIPSSLFGIKAILCKDIENSIRASTRLFKENSKTGRHLKNAVFWDITPCGSFKN